MNLTMSAFFAYAQLPTLPALPDGGQSIWAQTAFNWGLVLVLIAIGVGIFRARRMLDQIIEDANAGVLSGLREVKASVERLGEKVEHLGVRDGIVDMALRGMDGRVSSTEERLERVADRLARLEGKVNGL